MIPYGRQSISEEDIDAVVEVLRSDFLTQGPTIPAFEKAVCDYVGAEYAVAANSGTSALHLACMALGLGEGDWLWTSPITFVASANCGLYCGAKVDFVDIDPVTWNLSVERLKEKLETAKQQGCLPKILVAVHLAGLPCDMESIRVLSRQYGFYVVEDASHAIGGHYKNEPVGRCRFSDIVVFSFHPVKIITTGEGGMSITNDKTLADRMTLLRTHGITRDPGQMTSEPEGPWYYQQVDLGFNYRMTDIQAALGMSQLRRVDELVLQRHELADRYDDLLKDLPVQCPSRSDGAYSGMHLYVVRIKIDGSKNTHKQIFSYMRDKGIGVNVHYIPVHTQPYFRKLRTSGSSFPEAEQYYSEAISLPMFPELSEQQQTYVVDTLRKAISHAVGEE